MKYHLSIVLILISSIFSFSQSKKDNVNEKEYKFERDIFLSVGTSFQNSFHYDVNLLFGYPLGFCGHVTGLKGYRVGFETNAYKNFIYGPKVSYEIANNFICLRGSIISYIQHKDVDLRILPEIGVSFLGFANLTYGYSIPLLNNRLNDFSSHRIALNFNRRIPKYYF